MCKELLALLMKSSPNFSAVIEKTGRDTRKLTGATTLFKKKKKLASTIVTVPAQCQHGD